jgi:hypothetical protein
MQMDTLSTNTYGNRRKAPLPPDARAVDINRDIFSAAQAVAQRKVERMAVFEIFHEPAGLWRVRRNDGLVEGRFHDRRGALRFVRREFPGGNVMIVFRGALAE